MPEDGPVTVREVMNLDSAVEELEKDVQVFLRLWKHFMAEKSKESMGKLQKEAGGPLSGIEARSKEIGRTTRSIVSRVGVKFL